MVWGILLNLRRKVHPFEEDIERIVHRLLAAFDVEHPAAFVVDRIFARRIVRVAGVEILLHVFVGYADAGPAVVHAVDLLFGRHVGGGDGSQRAGTTCRRRTAVCSASIGRAEDDLLQGVGVLAVVAAEEVGMLPGRSESAHAEDRFAGGFGLRPHRGAGVNLGIEVHAGQQAVDRTLVGTRVVRARGGHSRSSSDARGRSAPRCSSRRHLCARACSGFTPPPKGEVSVVKGTSPNTSRAIQ